MIVSKERRLGRGLEALLGRPVDEAPQQLASAEPPAASDNADSNGEGLVRINVYEVDRNPYQPRKHFDDAGIQSLAESIADHGMLQPIIVRRARDRYQLISGERRWRAATVAGWETVPAQILDADDRQMSELAIVENIQRKDLNPLEKAASFQRYLQQYGCTQEELASRVKVDRSTIANLIRLLELPEAVQDAIRDGSITQGHARALLPLGDEREQIVFVRRIRDDSLSVRATEELVQATIRDADAEPLSVIGGNERSSRRPATRSEHVASLEQELRSALGTKVNIRQGQRGKGSIVVHFASNEEFERLRAQFIDRGQRPNKSQAG